MVRHLCCAHGDDFIARPVVQIKDAGKGIPVHKQLELSSSRMGGVGFRGMRERREQFGRLGYSIGQRRDCGNCDHAAAEHPKNLQNTRNECLRQDIVDRELQDAGLNGLLVKRSHPLL